MRYQGGRLTPREREVHGLILKDSTLTNKAIGEKLGIATTTVAVHKRSIYAKLGIQTQREQLERLATK